MTGMEGLPDEGIGQGLQAWPGGQSGCSLVEWGWKGWMGWRGTQARPAGPRKGLGLIEIEGLFGIVLT